MRKSSIAILACCLVFASVLPGFCGFIVLDMDSGSAPTGCTNVAGALSCVSFTGDGTGITGVIADGNETQIGRLITAGTSAKALALNANGANCSAGQIPLGVDATGAVEGCWTPSTDGNDTEINRLITTLVQGGTLSFSGVSYSTVRTTAPQAFKLFEGTGGGDNQLTVGVSGNLDANGTLTAEGATLSSNLNFATTGTITGRLYVTEDEDGNHTLTATELKGGTVEMDGNGTVMIDDNGTTGDLFCVKARTSGVKKVRPNKLSQPIYKHDMTNLGAGVAIKSGGAAGERACFYVSPNGYWQQEGDTTWVTE